MATKKEFKTKYKFCSGCGKEFLIPRINGLCNICELKEKQIKRQRRKNLNDF